MIYLYIAVLVIFLFIFALSGKENVYANTAGTKESSYPGEKFFLRAAAWSLRIKEKFISNYGKSEKRRKELIYKSGLGKKLKLLNPEIAEKQQVKAFYLKQYSYVFLIIFVGTVLSLCVAVSAHMNGIITKDGYIQRPDYGKGNIGLVLSAQVGGQKIQKITYDVEEQKIDEEKIKILYKEASELLPEVILGENAGLDNVTENLNLISAIENYPFKISWESSSYSLVHTDGSVQNEKLDKPEIVMLTACFKYDETEFEEAFPVRICPKNLTEQEMLVKSIEEALEDQNQASSTDKVMKLPEKIGSETVVWKEVIEDSSGYLFLLICVAAVAVLISQNKEVDEKLKKREKELLLDYPEVINKLTLYAGAGMTIRNAFIKMGEDYKKREDTVKKRYVYEEILLLCHELQSGVSETEAYTHLGKRCGIQQYMKLSAILSQNIRKGSNDLLRMIKHEAEDAFEERKNTAKKLGEEAGTKLLIPMMMMLCIVMIIIMVPAFLSFSA